MKKLFLALALVVTALPAMGIELHQASNEQLVQELRYRLGGGTGGQGTAVATYTCDSSAYLYIDLLSTSASQQKNFYVGNAETCRAQASQLSLNKSKIGTLDLVAVCDSSAYLYKVPLKGDGTFGEVKNIYVGNMANCLAQAKTINGAL